jgi:hypothetical protein
MLLLLDIRLSGCQLERRCTDKLVDHTEILSDRTSFEAYFDSQDLYGALEF